ncbi:hypothetical protein PUNSTDRAFT_56632 [Punctularia strigosozonata HHB-11173 SS5]|uniref:uncharacterized protein n=1 Tax=Punctularia strigosozonata (strain HHB-11173) TaxID=741275 RepID=UPI0004417F44|nr:uncharacterized protein PUNSTDRAFT_56632 [Punctularia strigosozonata HHB-11173 SS5]EIN14190.1 hypothetical protein PUNSTDRAFT_56632 [Punctularia strigosozonata HHB-11173 SS5]
MLRHAGRFLCHACRLTDAQRRFLTQAATTTVTTESSSSAGSSSAQPTVSPELLTKKNRRKRTAKAIESKLASRDFSEPTNLERWLAELSTGSLDPSLQDLERLKPEKLPNPDSDGYPAEYSALADLLCRTFSKAQLNRFVEMYSMEGWLCNPKRKKVEFAETIIERQWGWPSLLELENQKRDRTEVEVKDFPLDARQLFLMMGKDGADLLQMSIDFNVHISVSTSPLALRVEGVRKSMRALTTHIQALKTTFVEGTFDLPTPVPLPESLVQRISRISAAFIENVDNGGKVGGSGPQQRMFADTASQMRIHAKSSQGLSVAERLAVHASCVVSPILLPSLLVNN